MQSGLDYRNVEFYAVTINTGLIVFLISEIRKSSIFQQFVRNRTLITLIEDHR
ncbi:hypothetical protein BH23BAC3_BH23BAC3_24250 [soil metagenome]